MMLAIIRYRDGQRGEVLILSVGPYALRVVPRGGDDVLELISNGGQWTDENGAPVEFEAYIAGDGAEVGGILGLDLDLSRPSVLWNLGVLEPRWTDLPIS